MSETGGSIDSREEFKPTPAGQYKYWNEELTASLGNEAAELLREIFDGLKKDESLRLDGPKTASPTPEASIKTDEELIDELDFLDDDISETLSLEDLEEELNLEDLVFSELKLD